ncbi:hypothetical protein RUND412_004932 [Rhizina undulata]
MPVRSVPSPASPTSPCAPFNTSEHPHPQARQHLEHPPLQDQQQENSQQPTMQLPLSPPQIISGSSPSLTSVGPPLPPPSLNAHHPSRAPLSPPVQTDLEPSPVYSPLSTPAQTPKPLPSPPLGSSKPICKSEPSTLLPTVPKEPESEPSEKMVDASTNTDFIAMKSALRLLLLQRDRAKRDIVLLEQMRERALEEPGKFVEYLTTTRQKKPTPSSPPLSPSSNPDKNIDSSDSESEKNDYGVAASHLKSRKSRRPQSFANVPKPQEVYRCPPIEWEKYRILSAPLDRMHEEQRRRPSPSRPQGASPAPSISTSGVPQQMQTGGIIGGVGVGMGGVEYNDTIGGDGAGIQGRMRLFDGVIVQRGGVVGR